MKKKVFFKVNLPLELEDKISLFLTDLDDLFYFSEICIGAKNNFLKKKKKLIKEDFFPYIVSIFGGLTTFEKFGYIPYKEVYFEGDYIDRVKIKNFKKNENILIGKDYYDRCFISIKFKENEEEKVITIFQRFTYDSTTWTMGTYYSVNIYCFGYFLDRGFIKDTRFIDNLKDIIVKQNLIQNI